VCVCLCVLDARVCCVFPCADERYLCVCVYVCVCMYVCVCVLQISVYDNKAQHDQTNTKDPLYGLYAIIIHSGTMNERCCVYVCVSHTLTHSTHSLTAPIHTSHITHHTSHITHHTSHITHQPYKRIISGCGSLLLLRPRQQCTGPRTRGVETCALV